MPERVRLVHKVLEGRFHVYTSPDLQGLHASGDTQAEAQRIAMKVLDFMVSRKGGPLPVVTFEDSPDLLAAE